MSKRFEYETPGTLRKLAIMIKAPHKWRADVQPWIFDNKDGTRLQLAEDEDAKIGLLNERLARCSYPSDAAISEMAFDCVVSAIMEKRLGYVADWRRFSGWREADWDRWIGSLAQNH